MVQRFTSALGLLALLTSTYSLQAQDKRAGTHLPLDNPSAASSAPALPYVPGSLWSPSELAPKPEPTPSLSEMLSQRGPQNLNAQQRQANAAQFVFTDDATNGSVNITALKLRASARNASAENLVASLLSTLQTGQLALQQPADELEIYRDEVDVQGVRHLRLRQVFAGVPVHGGELIVHVGADGQTAISGRLQPSLKSFDTRAEFAADQASSLAYAEVGPRADYSLVEAAAAAHPEDVAPELMVFFDPQHQPHLAYRTVVHPTLAQRIELFIDAQDGQVLRKRDLICHAFDAHRLAAFAKTNAGCGEYVLAKADVHTDRVEDAYTTSDFSSPQFFLGPKVAQATDLNGRARTMQVFENPEAHYLIDATRPMFKPSSSVPRNVLGGIVTNDARNTYPGNAFKGVYTSSGNNTWSDRSTVSAHFNAEQSYEYFRRTFNRNSIDGVGGTIISFANTADENGGRMDNAFWNGKAMFYGNGDQAFKALAGSLDVGGHEMSHGVIQETAGLEYEGESGALNESFADIFGVLIDRDDWTLGEDIVKPGAFASGALRSMQDPHNGGRSLNDNGWQPSHYNERYTGSEDDGGVHINSGIPNKAFFLIASALGKEKAEQLYYSVLTNYLTRSSRFIDLRNGMQQATEQRYQRGSAEWNAVTSALDAVGIPGSTGGGGGTTPTNQSVNPGDALVVFTDAGEQVLRVVSAAGAVVFPDITPSAVPLSRPSVSDNGSQVVIVTDDGRLNQIFVDYRNNSFRENLVPFDLDNNGTSDLRNAAISRNGQRLALLTNREDEFLYVLDIPSNTSNAFRLYTPGSNGERVFTIDYADVMEWDYSGKEVIFDALNTVTGNNGLAYSNWDIGVIEAFTAPTGGSLSDGRILKLFDALTEGTSVGNPTLAKNSEYIMAFDYIDGDNNIVTAINLETGANNSIFEGAKLGWPTYAPSDSKLYFSATSEGSDVIGVVSLGPDKISVPSNQANVFVNDAARSTAFANGTRVISGLAEILAGADWVVAPNPTADVVQILRREGAVVSLVHFEVYDVAGRLQFTRPGTVTEIDLSVLPKGEYVVRQGDRSVVVVRG